MEHYNVEMLKMLQNVITPAPEEPRIEENERNVANDVVEYNVQLQMLQLLQQMQRTLNENAQNGNQRDNNRNRGGGASRHHHRTPDNANFSPSYHKQLLLDAWWMSTHLMCMHQTSFMTPDQGNFR